VRLITAYYNSSVLQVMRGTLLDPPLQLAFVRSLTLQIEQFFNSLQLGLHSDSALHPIADSTTPSQVLDPTQRAILHGCFLAFTGVPTTQSMSAEAVNAIGGGDEMLPLILEGLGGLPAGGAEAQSRIKTALRLAHLTPAALP